MFLFNSPYRISTSILMIAAIVATMVFSYVLLPLQQAKAQGDASFIEQVIQFIEQISQYVLESISWAKDYVEQNLIKYYNQITSKIQQWTKTDILNQRSLKDAWNQTRAKLLQQLTNSILQWAQGKNGQTNFVTDWETYLSGQVNKNVNDFITNTINTTNYYSGYAANIKQDVKTAVNPDYQQTLTCPIGDSAMTDFYNGNFTWTGWVAAIKNNYASDFFNSLDEVAQEADMAQKSEIAKLTSNQGFKGDANTPGIIQSYASQRASMMDFDYLLSSQNINEYLSSVVDAFINRIQNEGLSGMKLNNYQYHKDQIYKPTVPPEEQDLNFVIQNNDYFDAMANDGLKLVEQNLLELQKQENKNLGLLQQIQCIQQGCSVTTTSVDGQVTSLLAEIKITNSQLALVRTAITDMAAAWTASKAVIEANNARDGSKKLEDAYSAAMADFKTAYAKVADDKGNGSLQKLLQTTETDPQTLNSQVSEYAGKIVDQTTKLISDYPQACQNAANNNQAGSLCWQLAKEKTAAAGCAALASCKNIPNPPDPNPNPNPNPTPGNDMSAQWNSAIALNNPTNKGGHFGYENSDFLVRNGVDSWVKIDPLWAGQGINFVYFNSAIIDMNQGHMPGTLSSVVAYALDANNDLVSSRQLGSGDPGSYAFGEIFNAAGGYPNGFTSGRRYLLKITVTGADLGIDVFWGVSN